MNYKFNVFPSFRGEDVRKTFLCHLRKQFNHNGITTFDDQGIERSEKIAPSLIQAIRESRISIVILSKNYASSSWCLNELVEILLCKKAMGQIVMTIFYGVDPSDVRKQTGDFGSAFKKTCSRSTDEEKEKWSKALTDVSNILGEHQWDNEAKMIEKISKDVLDKLNATPSRDFDGMVGLGPHLREVESLLDLDNDRVKMVAITGPAGIGKTTIARALKSQLSDRFQLSCFVDNLRGSYHSGLDDYGLKLRLQEELLLKILNQDSMRIFHLGAIEKRLCDQRVLIILDDVNNIKQLEALANKTSWFGPGSRIVVTTENNELLQQHDINNTYHVGFPSDEEAVRILCRYAFRKKSLHHGFEKLTLKVTKLCGNLPLGLRVVGSSLRGKKREEWGKRIRRLETILDHQDIEEVLRVGYESLHEHEQSLFLHIAVFFNYKDGDLVKAMLADNNVDIEQGLKILLNKSLIYISTKGEIVMHKLLQQVGTKAVHNEEPWKHRILVDASEIWDVLERAKGTGVVSGISFDISDANEVSISERAFKNVPNLQFLKVYGNYKMLNIHEEMEFPHRLRLLHWEAYPSKCLPPTFHTEYLVELNMQDSQLEYLWKGIQPLTNLKKMDLLASRNLKELPDLSNATKLEILDLSCCESLVEIPSSFSHLHKLNELWLMDCRSLQGIPDHLNLASLEDVNMTGCSRLRKFPVISTNIRLLDITQTDVEDVPASISHCPHLYSLDLSCNGKLKRITHLPPSVIHLNLSYSAIKKIPDGIKALHLLQSFHLSGCRRLTSLPELPSSLRSLYADDCESLKKVFCPLDHTPNALLSFTNCFKLRQKTRRSIIRQSFIHGSALLPGKQVPGEFDHRARGNSLTIRFDGNKKINAFSSTVKLCIVVSPNHQNRGSYNRAPQELLYRRILNGDSDPLLDDENVVYVTDVSECRTDHLFVFDSGMLRVDCSEIKFEFSSKFQEFDVIECGAQIVTEKSIEGIRSNEFESSESLVDDTENGVIRCDSNLQGVKYNTDCWSWLFLCFGRSRKLLTWPFSNSSCDMETYGLFMGLVPKLLLNLRVSEN